MRFHPMLSNWILTDLAHLISILTRKTDIEMNLPKLFDLLIRNSFLQTARCRWAEDTGVDSEPADASQSYWIQIIICSAQNIKVNLGGELCVFVCLIVCVAGCNKPDETFEVCCPDSIMFDLWKLCALSRLLAHLLWLRCDLMLPPPLLCPGVHQP